MFSKLPQTAGNSENEGSTLVLLVTTVHNGQHLMRSTLARGRRGTYPSSKCLQRLIASCFLVLHVEHSNRSTIFLVVFAFSAALSAVASKWKSADRQDRESNGRDAAIGAWLRDEIRERAEP